MAKHDRFAKGSAVFTCACCDRKTRATNGDHAQNGLCAICYDLAGIENAFSDYGKDQAFSEYGVEARKLLDKLYTMGGKVGNWQGLMADLDACEKAAKIATALTVPATPAHNRNAKVIVKATGVRVQLRTGEKVDTTVQADALTADVLKLIADWVA